MMKRLVMVSAAFFLLAGHACAKEKAVNCAGMAMLGGAQLACSHVDPNAPAQFCTYSWSLHSTENGQKTVEGSFMLPPGAKNVTVYQGSGFDSAYSDPIVLCRGRKDHG
jgi:hypothetical protein